MSRKLWCFFGVHQYEVLRQGPLTYVNYSGQPTGATGRYYDLRCKCCGKITSKDT